MPNPIEYLTRPNSVAVEFESAIPGSPNSITPPPLALLHFGVQFRTDQYDDG